MQANEHSVQKKTMYGPPPIPDTPSPVINSTLRDLFGTAKDNPGKYIIGLLVCNMYTLITLVYKKLQPSSEPSHRAWMIASGCVTAAAIIALFIGYHLVIASAFVLGYLVYYATIISGLMLIGVGVGGMVFFNKKAAADSKHY